MEGLAGTAIRPAVRVPSCPQAPVLGRAHGSPVARGSSCGWLRPRPPCRPQSREPGISAGVSDISRCGRWHRSPYLDSKDPVPAVRCGSPEPGSRHNPATENRLESRSRYRLAPPLAVRVRAIPASGFTESDTWRALSCQVSSAPFWPDDLSGTVGGNDENCCLGCKSPGRCRPRGGQVAPQNVGRIGCEWAGSDRPRRSTRRPR
jgi:hypothetical protein